MKQDTLSKLQKALGKDTVAELEAMTPESLKERIAQAQGAIRHAKAELEANPKYQELKESLNAATASYDELKKRQTQITEYALIQLDNSGG